MAKREYKSDKQYETADERAAKQTYIVRQTCLDRACGLVVAGKIAENNLLKVAEKFEDWVMRKVEVEPKAEVE